jgi:hypothetical protein
MSDKPPPASEAALTPAEIAQPTEEQKREAIALTRALGKAEIEIARSYAAPFFWTLRQIDGSETVKGGSAFILDTGESVFGVTAAHVAQQCLQDAGRRNFVQSMLGGSLGWSVPFRLGDRIIDSSPDIDIATFWLKPEEIAATGRETLRGCYNRWPPPLAEVGGDVTFCGFPGRGRRLLAPMEIDFGAFAMAGVLTSCSETSLSVQIERDRLLQVRGDTPMPETYDFGGVSGGPVLAIVQGSWMPAGVIIQGPNPSGVGGEAILGLEIIKARPVHFIKADGCLDLTRWEQCHP